KTYLNPAIHGVENADYVLHAVDVLTLAEKPNFPVSVFGQQSHNDPRKHFIPGHQLQRTGLLLMDNSIHVAFGSICDMFNYTGWIMSFDKVTGKNLAAWKTDAETANQGMGGVWMGGSGLASDRSGSIFFNVGNAGPTYTSPMPGSSPPLSAGQCAMRLDVQASKQLVAADFFLMYDYEPLNEVDMDFGSGGFTMFPRTTSSGQPAFGGHKLATGIGKSGIVYVMNPDSLGGFMQGTGGSDNVIQRITGPGVVFGQATAYPEEGGYFYFYPSANTIQAYKYNQDINGNPSFTYAGATDIVPAWFTGSPVVSSLNGQPGSGILWFIDQAGALYAYSAVPSGGALVQLYSHSPGPGTYSKWLRPTIGSSRVFTVTNDGRVFCFGSPASFPLSAPATAFGIVTVGSSVSVNVTFTAHISTSIVSFAVGDPNFALVSNPSLPIVVQPNQVLKVIVMFKPLSYGSFASTLLVATSSGTPNEFSASLSGSGQLAGPELLVSPPLISYGGVVAGSGAVNVAVLLSNSGNQDVTILGYSLPTSPYSALSLPPVGSVITVGSSVSATIQFYPTAIGAFSSSFGVQSTGGSQTVTLTGLGAAPPKLVLQMQNLDGSYSINNLNMSMGSLYPNSNRILNLIISNAGNSTLILSKVKPPLTGNIYTSPSSVVEGQQLPVGGTIVVPINFLVPASSIMGAPPITFSAVFIINSNDPNAGVQTISFTGTEIFKPLAAPFQNTTYLGCFADSPTARALPTQEIFGGSTTLEICLQTCLTAGFRYAGAEFGVECYCGNQPPPTATPVSTDCTMSCAGNGAESFYMKTYLNPAIHGVENADYVFHAVDVLTLAEKPNFPVSVFGQQSQNDPRKHFIPGHQLQRPGLLLLDNSIHVAFGSICDMFNYTGWIMSFDKVTGKNLAAWTTDAEPANQGMGGVWMGGSGLASDRSGSIFFTVGNAGPTYTSPMPGSSPPLSAGQCAMRVDVQASQQLAAADYFLMYDYEPLNEVDMDFGSGGFTMFPRTTSSGQPAFGGHKLATGIGKSGIVYVMNPDRLGGFMQGTGGSDNVIQRITGPGVVFGQATAYPEEGGYFYFYPSANTIQAYKYNQDINGNPSFTYAGATDIVPAWFTGSPVVSSLNGQPGSGILWFIDQAGALYAYSAVPSGGALVQLYSHSPGPGTYSKWLRPTIGSSRVFTVTNDGRVFCFGSPASFPLSAPATAFGTVTVGSSVSVNVTFTAHISTSIVSFAVGDPNFALVSNPSLPIVVQPNQVLKVIVMFKPLSYGSFASTLLVATSSGTPNEFSASLSGSGQLAGPKLLVSPPLISYGGVVAGSGAVNVAVLLSNSGNQDVTILGYSLPTSPYSALSLPPVRSVITVGSSISVTIQFYPTVIGAFSSSFGVQSTGGSQTVTLTGLGASPPKLVLQMQNLDGSYSINNLKMSMGSLYPNTNRTLNVIISNAGKSTLILSKVKPPLTGNIYTNPSSVVEGQQIAVGGQIVVPITFLVPASSIMGAPPITFSAVFIINSNDPNAGVQTISFTGTEIFRPLAAPFQNAIYLGCFADSLTKRVLPTQEIFGGSTTLEICLQTCSTAGFRYAGAEFGVECYCGNQPPPAATPVSTMCTMACAGNGAEICGGISAISVFDMTPTPPIPVNPVVPNWKYDPPKSAMEYPGRDLAGGFGYGGLEFGVQCFCGGSAPIAAVSTMCTLTCQGNSTELCGGANAISVYGHSAVTPTNPTVANWKYLGCFVDSAAPRTISNQQWNLPPLTVEICLAACVTGGFKYGGVEFGSQCFCGNTAPTVALSNACTSSCNGNAAELCGGANAISVYDPTTVTPTNPTVTNWVYLGCFLDSIPTGRLLPNQQWNLPALTVETCLAKCSAGGFKYGGVEFGNQCFCGTPASLLAPAADGFCSMACQGNPAEYKYSSLSSGFTDDGGYCCIFLAENCYLDVVDVHLHRLRNHKCGKKQREFQSLSNGFIDRKFAFFYCNFVVNHGSRDISDLHGNYSTVIHIHEQFDPSLATPTNPIVPNWEFTGCYKDSAANRTLSIPRTNVTSVTIETCTDSCAKGGFQYGGVEAGNQCFCGSATPVAALSTACSMTCQGNSTEWCGGQSAVSVYRYFPAINPVIPNWPYLGCYLDNPASQTLATPKLGISTYTVETCASACEVGKFQYAGLELANQCFCGNSLAATILSTACTMTCQGNGTEVGYLVRGPMQVPQRQDHRSSHWALAGYCRSAKCDGPYQQFLIPKLDSEAIRTIDVILTSNLETMLALPFISEFGGFKGKIFATDPTVLFGKLRLEEFIKRFISLAAMYLPMYRNGRPAYSDGIEFWILPWFDKLDDHILYLSTSTLTLNKHSAPMNRTSLPQADFVIANNSASPTHDASATQILNKSSKIVYSQLARCIDTGGTAVFMCKPFGTLFDLLELVESIMAGMGITVVVHVVGSVANESLKVCNILGEWMNKERQDSVFGSKLPLGHGKMIESKRLITHKSIHTVFAAKPQVVFLDYSEQSQETLEAFMKWRGDKCVYILPESEFPSNLAPIFANSRFNLLHCPFNTSASESELISLLESIQPGLGIAIPHGSNAFNSAFTKGTVGLVDPSCGPFAIPIDSTKRSIKIEKAVAMGGGFVGADAWSVDGLIRVDAAGGCVLREDGGRGRMVVLKEVGLVRRILDRALVE
ncbi:hypothetical protein HDU98_011220, partial [Podochytrium sp. JEL0797]